MGEGEGQGEWWDREEGTDFWLSLPGLLSQYLSRSLPLLGSKTSVRSPFSCPRLALLVFLITRNYRQTELSKNNKHRQTPSHPESQKGLEVVSSGFDRNENVAGPAPPWAPSEHLSQEACPARHSADTVPGSQQGSARLAAWINK